MDHLLYIVFSSIRPVTIKPTQRYGKFTDILSIIYRFQNEKILSQEFVLYYNCKIWLSTALNQGSKKQLLSASALTLKLCGNVTDRRIYFDKFHEFHNRVTPMKMMQYRLALLLYKLYNIENQSDDWMVTLTGWISIISKISMKGTIEFNIRENRNRHARGPVHHTSSLLEPQGCCW